MAAAQGRGGPLRRWKRFLPAFASIDAAIDAADPAGLSSSARAEVRDARRKIVELLRGATATDDGAAVAEELCAVLDGVMVESLLTLEMVPAMPRMLATTDLARDVAALRSHDSERVRALATGVVRGWRASVKAELARAAAAMEKSCPARWSPTRPTPTTNTMPRRRQQSPHHCRRRRLSPRSRAPRPYTAEAINAAKRKLREGYKEAEEAKRRRTVKVIEAPEDMAKKQQQQQRKRHPIMQQRDRSRYPSSTSSRPRV
uniref:TFIIS N-terminal domain-containing protein n=1 Tax=Oryza punctata TaxID=4537 RepID=A0A0E0K0R0_ORYPU